MSGHRGQLLGGQSQLVSHSALAPIASPSTASAPPVIGGLSDAGKHTYVCLGFAWLGYMIVYQSCVAHLEDHMNMVWLGQLETYKLYSHWWAAKHLIIIIRCRIKLPIILTC